jgi:hypothetical protein
MHRWPEMETAIDVLIDRQRTLVRWWDDHVRAAGNQPNNPVPALIAATEAERMIDMRQEAVSRFRSALADAAAYRGRLIARARRDAGIDPGSNDPTSLRAQPARVGPDFWPTPHSLVEAFICHVVPLLPRAMIWECAAGDGRLVNALLEAGQAVYASDLYPQDGSEPWDFLTQLPPIPMPIAATNPPFNASDEFIERGLELLDDGAIAGLVLLLRHDHLQAATRTTAFNRATFEVHCNWRPIWIEGTEGQPRWSFHWIGWTNRQRRAPLYLVNGGPDDV